jgi:hypothetical protein
MDEDKRYRGPTPVDPEFEDDVFELLKGAVDIHCHSGPSAMPRVLSHREQQIEADDAGFSAVLYKDHFYPGMAHAKLLSEVFPERRIKLFSGVALNNSNGGINPFAVDHCVVMGGKLVWMPTLSAANHVSKHLTAAKNFPTTWRPMMPQEPLSVLGPDGKLTDATLKCIDLIAAADIILAGGHLHVSEQYILWEEAKKRGVRKMLVNHPTYETKRWLQISYIPEASQGAYTQTDLTATYNPPSAKWSVSAFVSNIENSNIKTVVYIGRIYTKAQGGLLSAMLQAPRTFGGRLDVKF